MQKMLVPIEKIEQTILLIRGKKVILDYDLAKLFGVPTKALKQAVKRNENRFPTDFMFQLTKDEKIEVVTNCDHLTNLKFSPSLPMAFTEHGTIMVANLLNSAAAVNTSVFIVRAFVRMRESLSLNKEIAQKVAELERKVNVHDKSIKSIVGAIRQLMEPPKPKKNQIGFHWNPEKPQRRSALPRSRRRQKGSNNSRACPRPVI